MNVQTTFLHNVQSITLEKNPFYSKNVLHEQIKMCISCCSEEQCLMEVNLVLTSNDNKTIQTMFKMIEEFNPVKQGG